MGSAPTSLCLGLMKGDPLRCAVKMTIARVIKKDAPNDFSKLKFSNRKIPEKHEISGADFFSGPSYLRFTYRFVTKRVLGMISLILGSRFRKTRNFGGENSSFHLQKLEF